MSISDKISNFDAVCTSDTGELFIVEMQGLPQESYADRMLCYASFPIRMQLAQKLSDIRSGKGRPMDYSLVPVYVLSFVNFAIPHEDEAILRDGLVSSYRICSPETGELMTEALYFAYLELGRLEVPFGEPGACTGLTQQLAYALKYMNRLTECPREFEDRLFPLLFEASEFANMNVDKQFKVTSIMRTELDRIAENEYARKQGVKQGLEQGVKRGLEQGRAEESRRMALKLRELGVDSAIIQQATGLNPKEIR